jgi:hypothetical protein
MALQWFFVPIKVQQHLGQVLKNSCCNSRKKCWGFLHAANVVNCQCLRLRNAFKFFFARSVRCFRVFFARSVRCFRSRNIKNFKSQCNTFWAAGLSCYLIQWIGPKRIFGHYDKKMLRFETHFWRKKLLPQQGKRKKHCSCTWSSRDRFSDLIHAYVCT